MSNLLTVFTTDWVVGLIITIIVVVGVTILTILVSRKKKNMEDVIPVEQNETVDKEGEQPISPDEEEVVGPGVSLLAKRTYTVGKYNKLKPGTYVVKAVDDDNKLMIRLNDYVKEYENEFELTVSEGETICAVSKTIVLTEVAEKKAEQ